MATTELLEAFKTTTRQDHIGSKSQSRHEGEQQNPAWRAILMLTVIGYDVH